MVSSSFWWRPQKELDTLWEKVAPVYPGAGRAGMHAWMVEPHVVAMTRSKQEHELVRDPTPQNLHWCPASTREKQVHFFPDGVKLVVVAPPKRA